MVVHFVSHFKGIGGKRETNTSLQALLVSENAPKGDETRLGFVRHLISATRILVSGHFTVDVKAAFTAESKLIRRFLAYGFFLVRHDETWIVAIYLRQSAMAGKSDPSKEVSFFMPRIT